MGERTLWEDSHVEGAKKANKKHTVRKGGALGENQKRKMDPDRRGVAKGLHAHHRRGSLWGRRIKKRNLRQRVLLGKRKRMSKGVNQEEVKLSSFWGEEKKKKTPLIERSGGGKGKKKKRKKG